MTSEHSGRAPEDLKLHGLLAEFDNVDDLLAACRTVRDAGYRKWDAHTPFPVHGIDEAMGIKATILPWIVLGGGLTGLGGALLMQWWMNAIDYPFLVSGKPFFSVPANIPVCFELTVLLSALTSFLMALVLNLLPQLYHPLFRSERFKRSTDDRFFVSIEASDPQFEEERTRELLGEASRYPVETIHDEKRASPLPAGIHYVGAIATLASFVPLVFIAKARYEPSEKPRVHIFWEMDWQPKLKAQRAFKLPGSELFEDGRAWRPQVMNTVSVEESVNDADVPMLTGKNLDGSFVPKDQYPMAVTDALMMRGRERYEIYCTPCHGKLGEGNGIVAIRAERLAEGLFVPPVSHQADAVRDQPNGQIFQTITNGVRTMPAYGQQIEPKDRWAIILYMRALQRSQHQTTDQIEDATARERLQQQLKPK